MSIKILSQSFNTLADISTNAAEIKQDRIAGREMFFMYTAAILEGHDTVFDTGTSFLQMKPKHQVFLKYYTCFFLTQFQFQHVWLPRKTFS